MTGETKELDPELESIRARAAAADAAAADQSDTSLESSGTGAASEAAPAGPAPTFAQELAGVMFALGSMAAMRFPSLKAIYTQDNCTRLAGDIAPALEQLGWTFTGGASMIYIKAGGAVLMLAMSTRDAVLQDLAAEKKAQGAADPGKPAGEGSESPAGGPPVAPGPGVHDQVKLYQ